MTPAIELLRRLGIDHEIHEYDHDPKHLSFGDEAVKALDVSSDIVFKTLMVTLDNKSYATAIIPVRAKLARMTDPAVVQRRSGYVIGGISPFAQKHLVPTFIDECAAKLDQIYCSAGRRGVEITISPETFETVLNATFTPIAAWQVR